jgi:hypothetical protein
MKILAAFGCSHVNGSMLDGKNGSSEYNIRNGFPGMLAKKYGYQLHNISKPGGSNQFIHRSVIHYVHNHVKDNREYLFLIGWTGLNRIELRYPDNTKHIHATRGDFLDQKNIPFTPGTDPYLFKTFPVRDLLNFAPFLFPETALRERWASYCIGLQNVLKNKNIKFVMFNTCERHEMIPTTKPILDRIDKSHYIDPQDQEAVYIDYLLGLGIEKTECWHFRHDGHKAWADVLERRLKILNYV